MKITTIGLDLAKSVFQLHCIDSTQITPCSAGAIHR